MRRLLRNLIVVVGLFAAVGLVPVAESRAVACPNCKNANETSNRLPRAYMYSILFMLGMPATVFSGFALSFYRLSRKQQALQDAEQAGEDTAV